jgi:hypothetical protein
MRATNLGHKAGISGDMGWVRIVMPTTVRAGRSMVLMVISELLEAAVAPRRLVEQAARISTPAKRKPCHHH